MLSICCIILYFYGLKIKKRNMITVKTDDKSPAGMRIIKDLRRHGRVVNFDVPDVAPEGYLTGDEFERRCMDNISRFYHEKGIL
jgi:hypothetical protein